MRIATTQRQNAHLASEGVCGSLLSDKAYVKHVSVDGATNEVIIVPCALGHQ